MKMKRQDAEILLKDKFRIERFYDKQWEVIDKLLNGKRVLLIEKTGYGKSLCFQFTAVMLDGLTVIFSPLISLMRDQIKKLNSLGINAKCINSEQTDEENEQVINDAMQGRIKILYIAPERQENNQWIESALKMKLSMVVVDEAHCISVWGHDFRPSYRRIINLVKLLPQGFPVLAATATATKRVEEDIANQIGSGIEVIRGNLMRDNFRLFVIKVNSEDEKFIWFGQNLKNLEGSGVIYTGTRVNTEMYSRWFEFLGIKSVNYNAGLDARSRIEIENGLMNNEWKCVVSTNALGMGIDKPDIRFIIHTQIPQSPIHYYQEIGRAGRDGLPTEIILFFNPEDEDLPVAFIEGGRPSVSKYHKVIEAVKNEMLGERELMKKTNLKQTQVRVIKADLLEQGIVREVTIGKSKKLEYIPNAPVLNFKTFEELRNAKLKELDSMIQYINTPGSRMKFLCDFLGDSTEVSNNNCDNTGLQKLTVNITPEWNEKLKEFRDNYFPGLEVELKRTNMVNGVAASYYGFSNVGKILHRCKYENGGDYPDSLVALTINAFREKLGQYKFDIILYVPPTKSGNLVKNFSEKISQKLNIPVSHNLKKTRLTKEQKIFENNPLKAENVKNAFVFENLSDIFNKKILLIDDIFDSGTTMKEIGKYLTESGAALIAPLVIAKTVGGDFDSIKKNVSIENEKISCDLSSYNTCKELIYNKVNIISANVSELFIRGMVDEKDNTIGFLDDLKFLQDKKNVKILDLSHNQIIDIEPLKYLRDVEVINFGDNKISMFNIINNNNVIKELHLHFNQITDIKDISKLYKLEILSLAYNNINNLEALSNLKKLRWLSLCGNPINDISQLFKISTLEVVTLSHTLISENDKEKLSEKGIETSWYWYEFWH